ncbi:hypothetical protein NPIL_546801 [Nephila pilipes]|uniref:Uncharacterized protein n=1 Tax=Nephila pilipes TaxID=299642 RepID=A0A8X6QTG9_NEPPI|nr:hypothetical protein NPIL_546801 [Nephila pilipes]
MCVSKRALGCSRLTNAAGERALYSLGRKERFRFLTMSRRKQAKPRALKREDMESIPDENTEEITLCSLTNDDLKGDELSCLIDEENNSLMDATLNDNSLETIGSNTGTLDLDDSRDSEVNTFRIRC